MVYQWAEDKATTPTLGVRPILSDGKQTIFFFPQALISQKLTLAAIYCPRIDTCWRPPVGLPSPFIALLDFPTRDGGKNFPESYRPWTSLEVGRRVPSRRIDPSSPLPINAAIDNCRFDLTIGYESSA